MEANLIAALKDLLLKSLKPPEQNQGDLLRAITVLKELGVIGKREKSGGTFETLKAMKDALGLRYAHEVEDAESDPMAVVEEYKNLVDALRLWMPKPNKPSIVPSLIEVLSKAASSIIGTLRSVIETNRINAYRRMIASPRFLPPRQEEGSKDGNGDGGGEDIEEDKIFDPMHHPLPPLHNPFK